MEIINDLTKRLAFKNPVVTIGNFDGVHLGHQKIFRQVVDKAEEIGGTPIVITFHPHPMRVLAPERGLKMIYSPVDKQKLIGRIGIKALICISFDRNFAHTDPEVFIRNVLVDMIGAKWIIVGHSYSFGKGKKGTTSMLRIKGRKYGFKVHVVRYARVSDGVVSSSRIRGLLLRGRVREASSMLGRAYHISGTVITGAGRGGPLLHTPTANITTSSELIPKEGVYAVRVSVPSMPSEIYDGVANIGNNPTFNETAMSYEVHLFDFNRNIIGEKLQIHFIDRIREEKKFLSVQELIENIDKDIAQAKKILSSNKDTLFL
ncbi:MAG: bifunctional riboflavin kinase/FAD synthetase [Nitrospirae bacterium]|nr:bifunctional riboflavin kinase/FAD synthetase [Nitrospirota bacterium]